MKEKYQKWIDKNYPTPVFMENQCANAVIDMSVKFMELKIQTGRANGKLHCWLVGEAGEIVDPTAGQFKQPIKYQKIADRFLKKDEFEPATGAVFI